MQSFCRLLHYLDTSLQFSPRSFFFFFPLRKRLDPSHLENITDGVVPTFRSGALTETWGHMCSSAVSCACGLTFLVFAPPGRWGKIPPSAETLQPQLQQLPGRLRALHPVTLPPELQSTRYQPQIGAAHCLNRSKLSCENFWPCEPNLLPDLQIMSWPHVYVPLKCLILNKTNDFLFSFSGGVGGVISFGHSSLFFFAVFMLHALLCTIRFIQNETGFFRNIMAFATQTAGAGI